tara:strand:+ start:129 stop:716 length:588 start_codon:yes stop_codon:yes gene_type:complete
MGLKTTELYNKMTFPFELNKPYVFKKFNKKKCQKMKIIIVFTKLTKTYINYHYTQIEIYTGIHHPTITTRSKYEFINNVFDFQIKDKDFEYYKIWLTFFKNCPYKTSCHVSQRYLEKSTETMHPVPFVVKSDIRRYVDNLRKRINAKKLIVAYWCRARYNPEYKIARIYAMDNYYEDVIGIPPPPRQPLPPVPVQ